MNTKHGVELGGTVAEKKGSIETGKWYDIKIVTRGQSIKCYLNGKLVHDVNQGAVNPLYASATRDEKSGDVIVKVVNASAEAAEAVIELKGARPLASAGQAIVLRSDKAADENSLENPTKVAPKSVPLQIPGSEFTHSFPGNSFFPWQFIHGIADRQPKLERELHRMNSTQFHAPRKAIGAD